jgi:hypothetical protein
MHVNKKHYKKAPRFQRAAVLLVTVLMAACGGKPAQDAGQRSFGSPEEAVTALIQALEADDVAAANAILGPYAEDLLDSGDPVQDAGDRAAFVAAYKTKNALVADGDDSRTLLTGEDDWPFAVPVKKVDGRWIFDSEAGADELVYRRVGSNELGAIAVMRGFVDAQEEYASVGHDGDPPGLYALKLISDEGSENGLYGPTEEGEDPSPAGEFVAAAASEGYRAGGGTPYHGYYYRMLYKQGPNANGGEREYFKDGLLTEGFALLAWPADYQVSGVMTFIVDQDGVVFQKDLGDDTAAAAAAIQSFDPDSSWVAVTEPD